MQRARRAAAAAAAASRASAAYRIQLALAVSLTIMIVASAARCTAHSVFGGAAGFAAGSAVGKSTASCFVARTTRRTFVSHAAAATRRKLRSISHRVQQQQTGPRLLSRAMSSQSVDSFVDSIDMSSQTGNDVKGAMQSLAKADAVCFDVDSTVIAEEGIDVLAEFLGKGKEVSELTKKAMEGDTRFDDALEMRLGLLQPDKARIQDCLENHPPNLSTGVADLMKALQQKNVDIWLVSGGFRLMIEPVAVQLGIPVANIYANTILFNEAGIYAGFDRNEPTSRDMGKPKALSMIKEQHGYDTMIMVGDGATDAQAKPPADHFIGFGGVVARPAVQAKADWFVTSFDLMTSIIEHRS